MELTLYAQGSDLAPPKPDIQEGFDYAVNFATNILNNPAVIGTILIVLGTHYSQPIMTALVLAGLLSFLINPHLHLILNSLSPHFTSLSPHFHLSLTSF